MLYFFHVPSSTTTSKGSVVDVPKNSSSTLLPKGDENAYKLKSAEEPVKVEKTRAERGAVIGTRRIPGDGRREKS